MGQAGALPILQQFQRRRWRRVLAALAATLLLLVSYQWHTSAQKQLAYATLGCMDGVVTAQSGGRIGNLLMEYSSAAVLAQRHLLRLAMPAAILEPLSAIFQNLSAEPLAAVLGRPPCAGLGLGEQQFLDDPRHRLITRGAVEDRLRWLRRHHLPLVFRRYMMLPEHLATSLQFLRREFRFRPEIQRAADEKLQKIKLETAKATGANATKVCAVGVHVRRTDYFHFMESFFGLRGEVAVSYYEAAAAAMLADLRHECAAVAFAVTSDDSQWCRQHLLPAVARSASELSRAGRWFLLASSSAADDLCLLSSCQHLIMTYGTFGLSAAILSGGRTVMYDSVRHGARMPTLPEEMVPLVPGWRLVA